MEYKQDVQPNLQTAGNVGYCLAFVEAAFGTPHYGLNAHQAGQATQYQHPDQNFPANVYVLLWFDYILNGVNEGHVAIRFPDGRILSSPWELGTTQAILPNLAELERIYGDNGVHPVNYIFWSEDVAGVRVVEPVVPPPPLYTITGITPKQVVVAPGKSEWNLALPDLDTIAASPFTTTGGSQIITVVAQLQHSLIPQFIYYLQDANNPIGWNTVDCTDYIPPVPYVPPAAPVNATKAETYKLVTTLPYYGTEDDTQADRNAVSTIAEGTYIVWEKNGIYYNLTTDNQNNQNKWVNTLDNRITLKTNNLDPLPMTEVATTPNPLPLPADIDPATINWHGTLDLRYAGMYVFWSHTTQSNPNADKVEIYDLETGQIKKETSNGTYAQFSGKVQWTDGNWYGRMKDTNTSFHWYAAHIEDLLPYNEVYSTKTSLQERQTLHTLTLTDRLELGLATIKTIGKNIWDIVSPKEKK